MPKVRVHSFLGKTQGTIKKPSIYEMSACLCVLCGGQRDAPVSIICNGRQLFPLIMACSVTFWLLLTASTLLPCGPAPLCYHALCPALHTHSTQAGPSQTSSLSTEIGPKSGPWTKPAKKESSARRERNSLFFSVSKAGRKGAWSFQLPHPCPRGKILSLVRENPVPVQEDTVLPTPCHLQS